MPTINHIVILMLENRSFDHLFGFRKGVRGLTGNEFNLLDPNQPESASNPRFTVGAGAPFAITKGQGPGHSIGQTNLQLFSNKDGAGAVNNAGFVAAYRSELLADHVGTPDANDMAVVMQSFSPQSLPAINQLADSFALCDYWFAEVPGPTQPNRLYIHAATSEGLSHNVWNRPLHAKTIYEQLAENGKSWASYEHDTSEIRYYQNIAAETASFRKIDQFYQDCQNATLPNYSFIVPRMLNDAQGQMVNSEHAPHDVRFGEHLVAEIYEALRGNEALWKETLLVITYDEHGGFYDHVAPDAAPAPDELTAPLPDDPSWVPHFAFDRLGLRVGAVLASPYIEAGTIVTKKLQHTSCLVTARDCFGIQGNLTERDKSAASFLDVLTLAQPTNLGPVKLTRPDLPQFGATTTGGHPSHDSLDPLQQGIVFGVHQHTRSSHTKPADDHLPTTQAAASDFVKQRIATHRW